MTQLILASSSSHRAALLNRLAISFDQVAPEIDETPGKNELPHDLAIRLALEKAHAVSLKHHNSVVIGSDQVAVYQGQLVGKPGNPESAMQYLRTFSGGTVQFLTAVAVLSEQESVGHAVVETRVEFRRLSNDEIKRYVEADQPLDCAGSFRAEALGISLFESVFSQDPTAIIGLPLIETARLLRKAGFLIP